MKVYNLTVKNVCDRCGKEKEVVYKDHTAFNAAHNELPKGWARAEAWGSRVLCKACADGLKAVVKEYLGDEK